MKKSLLLILLNLVIFNVIAQTKRIQSNRPLGNLNLNAGNTVLQSAKIDVLSNNKINKKVNLSGLSGLQISREDLNKISVKSKKISPIRPVIAGLSLKYYGSYNKDNFIFLPKSTTGLKPLALIVIPETQYDAMFLYSGDLLFNARRGKEYRCTFNLEKLEEGSVIVRIGQNDYSIPIAPGRKSFSFKFWSQQAGYIKIRVSPLVLDKRRPYKLKSLFIKSIRIDEI